MTNSSGVDFEVGLIQGHRGHHWIQLLSFCIYLSSFTCMSYIFRPQHLPLEGEEHFLVSLTKIPEWSLRGSHQPNLYVCPAQNQSWNSHGKCWFPVQITSPSLWEQCPPQPRTSQPPSVPWGRGYVLLDLSRVVGNPKPYAGFLLPPECYWWGQQDIKVHYWQ